MIEIYGVPRVVEICEYSSRFRVPWVLQDGQDPPVSNDGRRLWKTHSIANRLLKTQKPPYKTSHSILCLFCNISTIVSAATNSDLLLQGRYTTIIGSCHNAIPSSSFFSDHYSIHRLLRISERTKTYNLFKVHKLITKREVTETGKL